ncbi:MAG: 2OG-Fe(II) oxygenase [Sulfitobacter sp.]
MKDISDKQNFIETDCLSADILAALFDEAIIAVRIREFIDADTCRVLAKKVLGKGFHHYENAAEIGRIGMAFYEAENTPKLLEEYFEGANSRISDLRNRCAPYVNPIDILRCQLDEHWPAGAHLEKIYGKKMYVGLSRVVEPNVYFLAHHDYISKDAPDSFQARSVHMQFAANIYLQLPETGGETEIWDKELSPQEFDDMRGSSYGISPDLLGDPDVVVAPKIGDLVIFNSHKMHAVRPSLDVPRLSLSCFVGYRGDHAPITYWS